jgi:hypothetical protein
MAARPAVGLLSLSRRLLGWLFADGWGFFVPYALLYVAALGLGLTNGRLRTLFWLMHWATAGLFVLYGGSRLRSHGGLVVLWSRGFAFWVALAAVFLLPGAYLEFPGDPWEHLRRLNAWPVDELVRSSPFAHRFAYFWGFSLLSAVDFVHRRLILDLYSAFWQMLLAFQVFRLARRLGFSPLWSRIQVIGALAFFGNGEFSFFRYYALSSTPLAYLAYLAAAIAFLDFLERRGERPFVTLTLCSVLIILDHVQELVLLLVFVSTAFLLHVHRRASPRLRRALVVSGGLLFLTGLVAGRVVMLYPHIFGVDPYAFFYPFVSRVASFRLWDPSLDYFRTLGVVGLAALFLAGVFHRRHPLLAALTLAPVVLLSFPPFALAMAHASSIRSSYRLLFLLPASFMLIASVEATLRDRPRPLRGRDWALATMVLAALLLAGLRAASPTFGKLPFQLHRPPSALAATAIDPAAQWFLENRKLDARCIVTSDPVTEWVVAAWLGREAGVDRVSGLRWLTPTTLAPWSIRGVEDLLHYSSTHNVCGYLAMGRLQKRTERDLGPRSWVGEMSGHWAPDAANAAARITPGFIGAAEALVDHGWRKTFVPPSYWYYEPPAQDARGAGP